jgi:AcrR family transcriptional regulator
MGRRSSHTPEELRELIIEATTTLIETKGLSELSARLIAQSIGYSAGTLYNVFTDLDDLILTVEYRLLDRLADRLNEVHNTGDHHRYVRDLAAAYLAFTQEKPRLWNLLLEHHMPASWQVPTALHSKIERVLSIVDTALTPLVENEEPARARLAARVLWASVHGIASLASAEKLTHVSAANASELVDDLVRTYLLGLQPQDRQKPARAPKVSRSSA